MTSLQTPPPETFRERSTPVLETDRLVLRAPRPEDAKAVAMLVDDRRIAENTTRIPHPYSLSDAEEFIASANGRESEAAFAVTTATDGTLVGMCGFDFRGDPAPEIGYWFGVPYWNNGYATEAARAVIDYAFNDLGYDVLLAGARVTNPASRRVLEKCGFQWTGVGLYRIRAIASSAPIDRYRLDRGLWASLRTWSNVRRVA